MQLTPKKISFIIVSYNNYLELGRCIESIKMQTLKADIIVIDNNSVKDELDEIKQIKDITLILNTKNLGFGKACNQGLDLVAKNMSEFAYLINQDAWLENAIHLENICKALLSQKEMAVISPLQLEKVGELEHKFSQLITKSNCEINLKGDGIFELNFVNAAAWLIDLRKINIKFDPDFFMYGEDYHFIKILKKRKFTCGVYEGSSVFHPKSLKQEYKISNHRMIHYGFLLSEWKIPQIYNSKLHIFLSLVKSYLIRSIKNDGWRQFYFRVIFILIFRLYKIFNTSNS